MLCSLALAALTAAPAQGGDLKLTNVRMTVGELGPTRTSNKLLPGDILFIGYDINGIAIDDDGIARYKMAMEIRKEGSDKPKFEQAPRELADFVPLRGNVIPARAFITIGLDEEPGSYTCKITVSDPKAKGREDSLTTKFEILKRDFGVVAVHTAYDDRGAIPAPATASIGQTIFVHFSAVEFKRDPKTKQPNVELRFEILDDKGTPTLPKPRLHVQDAGVDEKDGAMAMRFPVFASRPGKFTAKITATDKVANKTASYELPITVLPSQ